MKARYRSILVAFIQALWENLRGDLIRLMRINQQMYYDRADKHLDLYDDMKGDGFDDLYHRIMHYFYGALYWFCVCNARYKKD